MSNMDIWDQFASTDERYTYDIPEKRLTGIDTYYQIHRATNAWGPIGNKWGFEGKLTHQQVGDKVYCIYELDLSYPPEEGKWGKFGPVTGCCEFTDEDAPKKALTDALSKALSYLGFSADIFMSGTKPARKREEPTKVDESKLYVSALQQIGICEDENTLREYRDRLNGKKATPAGKPNLKKLLSKAQVDTLLARVRARMEELKLEEGTEAVSA